MGEAIRTFRRSTSVFFSNYHSFASTAALLVLPVSASVLLSQSLIPSSSPALQTLSSRLRLLFEAAGFPAASEFFTLLNLKLSQNIFAYLCTLPLSLTFLLLAKASIVVTIHTTLRRTLPSLPFSYPLRLYRSLLLTHVFNSFVILSSNAAIFSVLFITFNVVDIIGLSSTITVLALSVAGVILYSVIIANAMVACNLATIVSAVENSGGYLPVLKACMLIRGRASSAMTLALPANLGMAAVEALFQYRVVKPYCLSDKLSFPIICEAFSIMYMYSLLLVLDVIITCMFFRSCASTYDYETEFLEPEEKKGCLQA